MDEPLERWQQIRDLVETGQLDRALATIGLAMPQADAPARRRLACLRATVNVLLGNANAALSSATATHVEAHAANDPRGEAEALLAMGFALQALEAHANAIEVLTQVERLAERMEDASMRARAKRRLGVSLSVLGQHQTAEQLISEALAELTIHGPVAEAMHAEYSLITARSRAMDASVSGDAAALQYGQLCVIWRDFAGRMLEQGLIRLQSMALGNAGIAAQRASDYLQAEALLEAADQLHQQSSLVSHQAITQSHLGEVYLAQGKAQLGIAALKRALDLLHDTRPRDRMEIWEVLARVYEDGGDLALALGALKEVRALQKQLQDADGLLAAARREQREEVAKVINTWSQLADQDPLTGLPNRRAFDRYASQLSKGDTVGLQASLILFDLDHFKRVNDTYGHAAGDEVLRRFAQLLRGHSRSSDMPARLGGEEFAVLAGIEPEIARELAERVRLALESTRWPGLEPDLRVTLSAGVASTRDFPGDVFELARLQGLADKRLYAAKHAGRNRVICEGL